MFGGFFGISAVYVYFPYSVAKNNPNNRPSYGSVVLTLLGTFFCWIYFPSLNAALVRSQSSRFLAAINTVFAL